MIEWTNIIVAGLAFMGTAFGTYIAKNTQTALILQRLETLEKKQDRHNHIVEKVYSLEKQCGECSARVDEKLKVANHRIEDLEDDIDTIKH